MSEQDRSSDWQVVGAVALIALGALLFLNRIGGPWWGMVRDAFRFAGNVAWPLVIIAAGVLLLLNARHGGLGISGSNGKRIYRSRSERMVGGVLGGVAAYIGVDPTWIRIAYAVFAVATGVGPALLAYILAMIIIPEEPKSQPQPAAWPDTSAHPPAWAQQPSGSTETVQSPPPAPPVPPAPEPPAPPQG